MELYKRIKQRREELNMSQEDLAKLLNYKSRSSINKIEMGENDIPQSKIIAFAEALQTTPAYLMGWEGDVRIAKRTISSTDENDAPAFQAMARASSLPAAIRFETGQQSLNYVIEKEKIFWRNLRSLCDKQKLSWTDLALKIGYEPNEVIKWAETEHPIPSPDFLTKVASYFDLQEDVLFKPAPGDFAFTILDGLKRSKNESTDAPNFSVKFSHEPQKAIPILGKIRCGIPLLDQSNWDEQITLPDNIKADFAARAAGDSMRFAGILPDDIILFRETTEPYSGQIVATRHSNIDEGVNLKFFVNKNGQPLLRSANPDYKDIELNGNHQIIGIMTGMVRETSPSLSEYESMLTIKTDIENRWACVVSDATALGIEPEAIQTMIQMHANMVTRLTKR